MATQVNYAKSGKVHIAYRTVGEGPMDLVVVPGCRSHCDFVLRLYHRRGGDLASVTRCRRVDRYAWHL